MLEIITGLMITISAYILIDAFLPTKGADPIIVRRLSQLKEVDERTRTHGSEEIFKNLENQEKLKKSNLLEMLKDHSDYRIQFIGEFISKFKFIETVKYYLKIADVKMPVDLFFITICSIWFPLFMLGLVNANIFIILGSFAAASAPFFVLKMKFIQRKDKFTQQFPEALGTISNSLRAGHSLLSAFQTVASESEYPIGKIFKTVSDEISLGREVRETLIAMNESMPDSQDLKFFITAVLIQREVGGNLSEILDNLNNTIRERYKLQGLIKTQTAQAQLSGIVLGLAPVFISGAISFLNPQYMEPLFKTIMGNVVLAVAFMMSILGFVVIKKVTQIRV